MKRRRIPTDRRELKEALRRRYWGAEDAESVLGAWRGSGESLAGFARRHGLSRARLARWRDHLDGSGRSSPAFHPVRVVLAEEGTGASGGRVAVGVELIVAGGRRVAVHRGFDPAVLKELVEAVESWRC